MTTIFSKIIAKEVPADIVYQDEYVTAFKDIHPQAPVHILIVPNKEIPTADDVEEADELILGAYVCRCPKNRTADGDWR